MPDSILLRFRRRFSIQILRRKTLAATAPRVLPAAVSAQQMLTNDTVIKMPKARLWLRELRLLTCVCFFVNAAVSQVPDSKYGILDNATVGRFRNSAAEPMVMLDLNLARIKPSLVSDDQTFLNYFIMLNNCGDMRMFHALKSEFEYPAMAGFYKSKAAEILSSLSLPVGLMSPAYFLGDYDPARHSFPFVGYARPGAPKKSIKIDSLTIHADRRGLPCVNALFAIPSSALNSVLSGAGPFYTVSFKENNQFAELPMDEAHAKEYVEALRGGGRMVTVLLDVDILPQAPTSTMTGGFAYINLAGEIKKVTAVKTTMVSSVLGTLYP